MSFKFFEISEKREKGKFTKKVINILGIKISYTAPCMKDIDDFLEFERVRQNRRLNFNLIPSVYNNLYNAKDTDLFCLRNQKVCYIFSKKVLDFGYKNFEEYILGSRNVLAELLEYTRLNENSELYLMHCNRTSNEILWKYRMVDNNIVIHNFISVDDSKQYYIHDEILDEKYVINDSDKPYFRVKNSKRRFIDGIVVRDYLKKQTVEEQTRILIKLLDFVFENYTLEDGTMDRCLYDCHTGNFLMDKDENFYFIDDDFISDKPLSKEYVIRYLFRWNGDKEVMRNLLKHYGFTKNLPKIKKPSGKNTKNKLPVYFTYYT